MIMSSYDCPTYSNLNMDSKQYELKGSPLLEVNPIERRANCKLVTLSNQKQYLVGGITADAVSNLIYELRLSHEHQPPRLEWRQIHFDNDLFSPRNSFAACGMGNKIYVWGGLEMGTEGQQKCLGDLIEMDVVRLTYSHNKEKCAQYRSLSNCLSTQQPSYPILFPTPSSPTVVLMRSTTCPPISTDSGSKAKVPTNGKGSTSIAMNMRGIFGSIVHVCPK